jgi:hypothetical protein
VEPRAGLEDMEEGKFLIVTGIEPRPLGRRTRSQSLYRLRYPGSNVGGNLQNSNLRTFELEVYKQKTETPLHIEVSTLVGKLFNFLFVCIFALIEDVVIVVD